MSGSDEQNVHRTIERVARESYGRLVAYLSVNTHDLAAAEDALSEALLKSLTVWPRDGVPQNPEAWLLTTARHSAHRCCASSACGFGERADTSTSAGKHHGDQLLD